MHVRHKKRFRQCLPIEEGSLTSEQVNLSVKKCLLWKHFTVFKLTANIRLDNRFHLYAKWILDVGEGRNLEGVEGRERMWDDVIFNGDLVEEVYGKLLNPSTAFVGPRLVNFLKSRCILAVLNDVCDGYNDAVIERMPGEVLVSTSIDELVPESNTDHHRYNSEQLNAVNAPGFPPHKLKLKKNSVVMILRNLNVRQGLVNGERSTFYVDLRVRCPIYTCFRYATLGFGQEANGAALQDSKRQSLWRGSGDSAHFPQVRGSRIPFQVHAASVSCQAMFRDDREQEPR